jgi:serine/threonine-protein kinase
MDMGSRNGTRVNGQVIRQVDLKDGDRIQAGRTLIRVSIEAVTAPTGADSSRHGRPSRPPADRSTGSERTPCFSEPVAEAGRQSTIPARRAQLRAADLLKQATDPERIAQYRILRKLGSGGMGVVYQALDPSTGQHVAIKTILPGRAPSGTAVDRFLREASILQELEHPNIVHFREFGESSGTIFIAMDYVDGISGDQLLKELGGPLPVVRAARIVCQLLQALDYAHAKQFVHRDIKPSNLILTAAKGKEVAILTDFGLARAYQTSQLSGLTFSGDVKGTAAFMAPEQILNFRDAKPPVDIYSAGATLYHLLTTKYPYDLPLHFACQIAAVLEQEAIPILSRRPDIPRDLAKLVHKSLAKKPEDRFPKAAAMAKALQPFGQQR